MIETQSPRDIYMHILQINKYSFLLLLLLFVRLKVQKKVINTKHHTNIDAFAELYH